MIKGAWPWWTTMYVILCWVEAPHGKSQPCHVCWWLFSASEVITNSICNVISWDHVIEGLYDILYRTSLFVVTPLSLVTNFSHDITRPHVQRNMWLYEEIFLVRQHPAKFGGQRQYIMVLICYPISQYHIFKGSWLYG